MNWIQYWQYGGAHMIFSSGHLRYCNLNPHLTLFRYIFKHKCKGLWKRLTDDLWPLDDVAGAVHLSLFATKEGSRTSTQTRVLCPVIRSIRRLRSLCGATSPERTCLYRPTCSSMTSTRWGKVRGHMTEDAATPSSHLSKLNAWKTRS